MTAFNRRERRAISRNFKRIRGLKKRKANGAFGKYQFLGRYKSLRVLPSHKRTPENSNKLGVILDNKSKVEDKNNA